MAKAVGAEAQALHHLLAYAPWSVQALRTRRLTFLCQAKELQQWGFRCSVVLADSLSGEGSDFSSQLEQLQLKYVVAMRSHRGVWLPPGQRVRSTNWRPFERVFSNRKQHTRFFPRDRLWAARAHPLLPPHDRSPTTASREYLVHHDQSSGQDPK